MINVEKFFSAEEKERIHQAIVAAEARTSGEIVPMIVGASDRYTEVEQSGLIAGLIAGAAAGLTYGEVHLALPVVGAALGLLMCRLPPVKRRLTPKTRVNDAIHSRTLAAFTAHGLHYTRAHTGILILVSLLERRVHVLADQGINEKVQPGTWEEVVGILASGLKSGKACDAFCDAIKRCGDILATHFPSSPDNRDELEDKLITEK